MIQGQAWIAGKAPATSEVLLSLEDDADHAPVIIDLILPPPLQPGGQSITRALKFVPITRPDVRLLHDFLPEMIGITLYDHSLARW